MRSSGSMFCVPCVTCTIVRRRDRPPRGQCGRAGCVCSRPTKCTDGGPVAALEVEERAAARDHESPREHGLVERQLDGGSPTALAGPRERCRQAGGRTAARRRGARHPALSSRVRPGARPMPARRPCGPMMLSGSTATVAQRACPSAPRRAPRRPTAHRRRSHPRARAPIPSVRSATCSGRGLDEEVLHVDQQLAHALLADQAREGRRESFSSKSGAARHGTKARAGRLDLRRNARAGVEAHVVPAGDQRRRDGAQRCDVSGERHRRQQEASHRASCRHCGGVRPRIRAADRSTQNSRAALRHAARPREVVDDTATARRARARRRCEGDRRRPRRGRRARARAAAVAPASRATTGTPSGAVAAAPGYSPRYDETSSGCSRASHCMNHCFAPGRRCSAP